MVAPRQRYIGLSGTVRTKSAQKTAAHSLFTPALNSPIIS